MRHLALYARHAAGTPAFTDLLADLARGDRYLRRTALHLAMAARDLSFVEDMLAGPDLDLRRTALRAVRTLPVSDEACTRALQDAPTDLRLALYRALRHSGRRNVADLLLPGVSTRYGDQEAAALLPACTTATVAARLPGLVHAVTSWNALVKQHPSTVLDTVERELAALAGLGVSGWRRLGPVVLATAAADPVRVLDLWERHAREARVARPSGHAFARLLDADPVRATRLAAKGYHFGWNTSLLPSLVTRRLATWTDTEIVSIVRGNPTRLLAVLKALPPGRRATVFAACAAARGDHDDLWALPLLAWLPADMAEVEARRMLDWQASTWHPSRSRADDPEIPLRLTAHLPFQEAVDPLTHAATSGEPRLRGVARALLVECTARSGDPDLVAALLDELARRTGNEQDPVRVQLLGALAAVPVRLLAARCLPALRQLATHAVAARDCSSHTRDSLRRLAGRVLRHHPDHAVTRWALEVFEQLVGRFGAEGLGVPDEPLIPAASTRRRPRYGQNSEPAPTTHRLDLVLRRGQEHDLVAVLRPHLEAARSRDDHRLAVALARALGRRAWRLAELQADLHTAVRHAPDTVADRAATLWLHDPATREQRAADMIHQHPPAARLSVIERITLTRRTELLDLVLADALRVPRVQGRDSGRWTPAQTQRILGVLDTRISDRALSLDVRLAAVRSRGLVQLSPDLSAHEEPVIAEAALDALGDDGAGLPALLRHGSGPRSAVAVAALARCCQLVPPSRLGALLEESLFADGSKITLRKAVIGQLVRQRVPGAVDVLLRAWSLPDLHADVRIALVRALRTQFADPRTLAALASMAGEHASERLQRTVFETQPQDVAPESRPGYAELVHRVLAASVGPGVRFRGSGAFATWAPWYQGGFDELLAVVADDTDSSGDNALPAVVALIRTGAIRDDVLDLLRRLTASGTAAARDRREQIVNALGRPHRRGQHSTTGFWRTCLARDAVTLLAASPSGLSSAVRLAIATLPGPDTEVTSEVLADQLASVADLLPGRPVLAVHAASEVYHQFGTRVDDMRYFDDVLLPAARQLAHRQDLASGLFAVALTSIVGNHTSWVPTVRELLDALRQSSHPEVSQEAWDVRTT
ncbi:hypothetical protein [Longispora urticae]